jgi:FkbM family methyltransferase
MEADFAVTEKWDVPCLELIRRWTEDHPGACFFDVGANHGQFSLVVSRWLNSGSEQVYAFEPHPANRMVSIENLARNQCRNVDVVDCALAARPGTMTIYGDSVTATLQRKSGRCETLVRVDTLDVFCGRMGLVPDVIKIDVEGFELEVLRGAVETLKRHQDTVKVICEMHTFMWSDPDFDLKLMEVVKSTGLRAFRLDGTPVLRISDYGHDVLAKQFV